MVEQLDTTYATPRLIHTCPHCGGALQLASPTPTSPAAESAASLEPLRERGNNAVDRARSMLQAVGQGKSGRILPGLPLRLRRWLTLSLLLCLTGVLAWQAWTTPASPQVAPAASGAMPPAASVPISTTNTLAADQASALAVVAAYNAAEAEIARTLVLTPALSLLEPSGPLARQRNHELDLRRQAHASHTTRLLRWAVGAITLSDDTTTATVTTQETWQNQEIDRFPRTATVRVVYTLRRTSRQSPWQLTDAQSTVL